MTVGAGEVFGFLGPNGAGKTTTIRTLLDLLHPTSGAARIFGLDSRRDSVEIRVRIGNLPGDFDYDPRVTGRELVAYLGGVPGSPASGGARRSRQRFEADLDRPLGELSRGNRQKIGLIQALFHEPELLILDEPTTGLDPLMQEEFLELVAEERERGATVFLSSHELDEVERVCDRVGVIREGRLAAVERVAELTGKAYRHVRIEFSEPVDVVRIRRITGVRELECTADACPSKRTAISTAVVKVAARHTSDDLELRHARLEEIFITYYEGRSTSPPPPPPGRSTGDDAPARPHPARHRRPRPARTAARRSSAAARSAR